MTGRPSLQARVAVVLAVGMAAGFFCHANISITRPADDFSWYWLAARALIEGNNPYLAVQPGGPFNLDAPFLYPLTTAIVAVPFALLLSPAWAATVFVSVSAMLLAWGLTQDGFAKLPVFASAPFLWACGSGQMSPLMTAAALMPALAWLAPVKPNLGLAIFAYRPTRALVVGSSAFIILSLLIDPRWPAEWITALRYRTASNYGVPIALTGGPLVLLGLTRWRRADARLLVVLACVPQSLFFYDQLPLWLIPKTRLQTTVLSLLSLVGLILANFARPQHLTTAEASRFYGPIMFFTCYLPALAMILREPNEGPVPGWIEKQIGRFARAR